MTAVSPRDVWAVGQGAIVEHWNGQVWQATQAPLGSTDPDAVTVLSGVSARSAHDVWAVGGVSGNPNPGTVTEHWDGRAWTRVPSPNPGGSDLLNAVATVPGGPVVAVGYQPGTRVTSLVLRRS